MKNINNIYRKQNGSRSEEEIINRYKNKAAEHKTLTITQFVKKEYLK